MHAGLDASGVIGQSNIRKRHRMQRQTFGRIISTAPGAVRDISQAHSSSAQSSQITIKDGISHTESREPPEIPEAGAGSGGVNDQIGVAAKGGVWIRRAMDDDTAGVAALCSEAFGPLTFQGFPSFLRASDILQNQARRELHQDVNKQLSKAFLAKVEAQKQAREYRLVQMNGMMKAELDALKGRPVQFPTSSLQQRQAVQRWQRCRKFVCLVAIQDDDPTHAAGCACVSTAAIEAFLPPPFPSSAPRRCCVSNVAVSQKLRRQGVARKLLQKCETLARRWGYKDLWLHTDVSNVAATQLYRSLGFKEMKRDPVLFGPFQRILFRKEIQPWGTSGIHKPHEQLKASSVDTGTYRWDVAKVNPIP